MKNFFIRLMDDFAEIPYFVVLFAAMGFMNNLAWVQVNKTTNFEEWWYLKITTYVLYFMAIVIDQLYKLNKK